MISFLQALGAFIIALGLLITFHEFGHYWVARRFDVKILRFSIGFGRPLWLRRFGPDRSEFVIAALPIGGYVKMLDEREGDVSEAERARAFSNKPVGQRFAIVAAGPAFNFVFAIMVYWLMFMSGIPGLKPVIDTVAEGSIAAQAGLRPGDELRRVDGEDTATWTAAVDKLLGRVLDRGQVELTVVSAGGAERLVQVDVSAISVDELAGGKLLARLGLAPRRPVLPAAIGEVTRGGPAERAGLRRGDRILGADGNAVRDWGHLVELVRARPGGALELEVQRGTEQLQLRVEPERLRGEDGVEFGRIGVAPAAPTEIDPALQARERYGVFAALYKALDRTVDMSVLTLRLLGKMIVGDASVKNLSGPISIAQYAGESAGIGLIAFLGFLAIVSISLGVLNLLPIPLLDGGHLMYYLIELLKGSPVSDATQAIGQQLGLAILLGLMGLAFYNDIARLLG